MSENMRVYIAAPFFNETQLKVVKTIENILWVNEIRYFSPRSEGTLKEMSVEDRKKNMGKLFRSNVDHMDWCTHCVAVIDGYDTGTVWEMGYLFATNKKIITYTSEYKGINVMLNESIIAHCEDTVDLKAALLGDFEDKKTGDVI